MPGFFRRSLLQVAIMVLALGSVSLGHASLAWETKQVGLTAKLGDKEAVALFPFKNTGATTVTIREIQTTCECTAAELTKRIYAPGETGTIRAVFTLGDRMGTQERAVTVITDDPYAPIATLVLRVEIPDLLVYSARMLHWTIGSAPGEKSVEVTAAAGQRIAVIEVGEIARHEATARVEAVEAGRKYRLHIQPSRLDGPWTIPVNFLVRFEGGGQNSFMIYALVR